MNATVSDVEVIKNARKNLEDKMNRMTDDELKVFAREVLIKIGALDENGRPKEQIVTGDFFGW